MTLWKLRRVLLRRRLRLVGRRPAVLAFAAGAACLFCAVSRLCPTPAAAVAAGLVFSRHLTRRDLRFLCGFLPHPWRHVALEYLLLALLPCTVLALHGHWVHAAALMAAAPLMASIPQGRPPGMRLRRLRIGMLGGSPEWTAGIRRHPLFTGLLLCLAAAGTALPYVGFVVLMLIALCCCRFYGGNEPLQLLLLPEQGSARLLGCKVRTAWRNYFFATLPFAATAGCLHPQTLWLAAVWLPFSALLLLYAVLAKYAFYHPDHPAGSGSMTAQLGLAGFLIPPLLPVSLCLTVAYALRAEKNLNRYLYDYD